MDLNKLEELAKAALSLPADAGTAAEDLAMKAVHDWLPADTVLEIIALIRKREAQLAANTQALADTKLALLVQVEVNAVQIKTIAELQGRMGALISDKAAAEARAFALSEETGKQPLQVAPSVTIDTPEFRTLLDNLEVAGEIPDNEDGYYAALDAFIAHIDAHTARAVAAKQAEAESWRESALHARKVINSLHAAPQLPKQRHIYDWLHLVETKIGTPTAAAAARVLKEFYEGVEPATPAIQQEGAALDELVSALMYMDEFPAAQAGEKWIQQFAKDADKVEYTPDHGAQAPRVKWCAYFDSYDRLVAAYLLTRDAKNWTQLSKVRGEAFAPRAALAAPAPVQQAPVADAIKDHVLREVVNSLRDTAIQFHGAQQLRERLRRCLDPLLAAQPSPAQGEALTDACQRLQRAADALQQFKRDWQRVPHFADRVNKATRDAISMAIGPVVNLDAVGNPLDADAIRALNKQEPTA